jgi:hypothetical protein
MTAGDPLVASVHPTVIVPVIVPVSVGMNMMFSVADCPGPRSLVLGSGKLQLSTVTIGDADVEN